MPSKSSFRPVDTARLAHYLAIDVLSDITFREPFGFLAQDGDVHDYIKTQTALLPVFEWFSTLPSLNRLIRVGWISSLVLPTPNDMTGLRRLMGVSAFLSYTEICVADSQLQK